MSGQCAHRRAHQSKWWTRAAEEQVGAGALWAVEQHSGWHLLVCPASLLPPSLRPRPQPHRSRSRGRTQSHPAPQLGPQIPSMPWRQGDSGRPWSWIWTRCPPRWPGSPRWHSPVFLRFQGSVSNLVVAAKLFTSWFSWIKTLSRRLPSQPALFRLSARFSEGSAGYPYNSPTEREEEH